MALIKIDSLFQETTLSGNRSWKCKACGVDLGDIEDPYHEPGCPVLVLLNFQVRVTIAYTTRDRDNYPDTRYESEVSSSLSGALDWAEKRLLALTEESRSRWSEVENPQLLGLEFVYDLRGNEPATFKQHFDVCEGHCQAFLDAKKAEEERMAAAAQAAAQVKRYRKALHDLKEKKALYREEAYLASVEAFKKEFADLLEPNLEF
jgi:hypothetical protein